MIALQQQRTRRAFVAVERGAGDPTKDISALRRVKFVMKGGRTYVLWAAGR